MKKTAALLLAFAMLLSCAAYADDVVTTLAANSDRILTAAGAEAQINLMFNNLSALSSDTSTATYSYTITDLDHNGRLEFTAAIVEGTGLYTSGRLFEVNENLQGITEYNLNTSGNGKFLPDVLTTSAPSYTDKATGTIYYIFPDETRASTAETSEELKSVSLKNGTFSVSTLGSKKSYPSGSVQILECKNASGSDITPYEYDSLAANAYSGYENKTVYFDWFKLADATSAQRLKDSYSVFTGEKALATVVTPAAATPTTNPSIVYVTSNPNQLYITKSPTSEVVTEGGNAMFIARAENYNYITWRLVSPNGYTYYNMTEAVWNFQGLSVTGDGTTQIVLCNCPLSLSGWGIEAVFTGYNGQATTQRAYITVNKAPTAQLYAYPSSGYFEYCDQGIQLVAGSGDTIHYEISSSGGIYSASGDVQSGGYCYIGAIGNQRYDVYLYAYVVGNPSNAISCQYVMDCLPSYEEEIVYDPSSGQYDSSSAIPEYIQYLIEAAEFEDYIESIDMDEDTNYLDDLPIPPGWND